MLNLSFLLAVTNVLQGIKSGLESVGFKPEIKDLDFFQDDYGLKLAAGEDGDEGEEEDEDEDDDEEDDREAEEDGAQIDAVMKTDGRIE